MVKEFVTQWMQIACRPPWLSPESICERLKDESPILKCAMVPAGHCTHLFLTEGDVLFLYNMVWMIGAVGALVETEH